jgi:hypothetical protein
MVNLSRVFSVALLMPLTVMLAVTSCVNDPASPGVGALPRPSFDVSSEPTIGWPDYLIDQVFGDPATRGTVCVASRPGVTHEVHGQSILIAYPGYTISDTPCSTSTESDSTSDGAIGVAFDQPGPVTVTFSRPVAEAFVYAFQLFNCEGDHGSVTAYDTSGNSVTRALVSLDPDLLLCGQYWWSEYIGSVRIRYDIRVAYDLHAVLPPLTNVQRIVITPPAIRSWETCSTEFHDDFAYQTICGPLTGPEPFAVYFREASPTQSTPTVAIVRAEGPNGGSFTTASGENVLQLEATVTPPEEAGRTVWEIVDDPDDRVQTIPPGTIDPEFGRVAEAIIPLQDANRWSTITDGDRLDRKSLSVRVTAVVHTSQGGVRSMSAIVKQDEIDTMREEYQELGKLHFPDRGSIRGSSTNTGDYGVAVVNADFDMRLDALHQDWVPTGFAWSISSYFRNPVHNDYHITPRGAAESRHQYGCAADILTTHLSDPPTNIELKEARNFWNQLGKSARREGFSVESLTQQGLPDHVHVQRACF